MGYVLCQRDDLAAAVEQCLYRVAQEAIANVIYHADARCSPSEGTVRNHVSTIVDKLSVSDRTQAAVLAIQHGLGE